MTTKKFRTSKPNRLSRAHARILHLQAMLENHQAILVAQVTPMLQGQQHAIDELRREIAELRREVHRPGLVRRFRTWCFVQGCALQQRLGVALPASRGEV